MELDRKVVEVERLSKEKESREGGLEGLVKGMERKLELKEMVIKVGWIFSAPDLKKVFLEG